MIIFTKRPASLADAQWKILKLNRKSISTSAYFSICRDFEIRVAVSVHQQDGKMFQTKWRAVTG